ncbi:MAG: ATP-binding protein [Bacteroidales bacterium]|nr:ATP-binding protein [Bacteroidales bacterium]
MEKLQIKSRRKIKAVSDKYHRYLFNKINTNSQLISILGARGVGKTTILLQLAKYSGKEVLYVALDDLFFTENSLYSLAENFSQIGGELLLLDEVHKYPNWSRELKLIYDDLPDLKVIFTSSSVLDIYKGESDLSRRALNYHLKELSFREYLELYHQIKLPLISLDDIINNHTTLSDDLSKYFKPLKYLNAYYESGAYPYYEEDKYEYYQQLNNTINLILDIDLQSIENIEYSNIAKFKRLLYVLATNVPYTPNISKLADKISINRNALVQALHLLNKAELLHIVYKQNKSISTLTKPDKIWLHNTNLAYTISDELPDIGNLRETFFIQHISVGHIVSLPPKGDFYINNKYTFEIGGKNKTQHQIKNLDHAFVVKDNIESGTLNTIPLWLFGLLY